MENHPDEWRTRLLGGESDPESMLTMAKILVQAVEWAERGLAKAGTDLLATQASAVQWEQSYHTSPQIITQLLQCLDPAVGGQPPRDESVLGPWVRTTMAQIARLLKKADRITDPKTGLFTEAGLQTKEVKALVATAQEQLTGMLMEFQVMLDTIVALLTWETPMPALLARALAGEETALLRVLSLNPHLVSHPALTRAIQQKIAQRESDFLHDLARVLEQRPSVRKNAAIGFIVLVLWEAGLKRLTSNMMRGFLKAVGVPDLPTHQALERYRERLGLKRYVRE